MLLKSLLGCQLHHEPAPWPLWVLSANTWVVARHTATSWSRERAAVVWCVYWTEPCSLRGGCLDAVASNSTERTLHSQQQVVDFNQLPGVIAIGSGAVLTLINLRLNNVAYKV